MHVRVAAEPAPVIHIRPAPQPELQPPLARFDGDALAERLVFEPAGDVDEDLAAWQPALATTVDVGIGDLPETQITAHVDMPRVVVGVDMVVVAMRLVGHAV